MELIKGLKDEISTITNDAITTESVIIVLEILQALCDKGGETQWSIKDQITLAIEELKF